MKPDSHTYDLLIKVQGEKGANRPFDEIESDSTPHMINTHNDEFGSDSIRPFVNSVIFHVMLNNIIVERTFTWQPDNIIRVRDASDFKQIPKDHCNQTWIVTTLRIHGQACRGLSRRW
jgi:hypothetical protein